MKTATAKRKRETRKKDTDVYQKRINELNASLPPNCGYIYVSPAVAFEEAAKAQQEGRFSK